MTAAVNLKALLGGDVPCPTCDVGALKTDADRLRGYCGICHLTKNGTGFDPEEAARRVRQAFPAMAEVAARNHRLTFRSEAETYDEGVWDDD